MKQKVARMLLGILVFGIPVLFAADTKLDGAYKFVSVTFSGGSQTEANAKGMIVVHGKYWSNVRAAVDRKTWGREDAEADRMKKIVAAYQGLTAGCGTFEIDGNIVTMHQLAGANPGAMGSSSKWEFNLEGNKLTLKPQANPDVTFVFERLP